MTLLKSKSTFGILVLLGFVLGACSGYYSSIPIDGIYGYRQIEIQHERTPKRTKSSYYKNYFNNLSEQEKFSQYDSSPLQDTLSTELEEYSDSQAYQTHAPWSQGKSTIRIIINDYYPHNYGFGFYHHPWYVGFRPYYGFGHRYDFLHSRRFFPSWHHFYDSWHHPWYYPSYAYNPYFGYEYGYPNYWIPRRFRYWNAYPHYGYGWDYPVAYRDYRAEGYSGVSYVRGRRNQPTKFTEPQNKTTRRAKEPKNSSSVSNAVSTRLALSRLQSSLVTPRYHGFQRPILSRSGSPNTATTSTTKGKENNANTLVSRTRTSAAKLSHDRETNSTQRKNRVSVPRYQVSTSKRTAESSIDSKSKSSANATTSNSYRQPRTTRTYRSQAQPNRRTSTSVKRTNTRQSTATKSSPSNYRSSSRSSSSGYQSHTTRSRTQYTQPKTSRSYPSRSSRASSSQPKRSSYSSSRSSSSNSRGRSSSSSRRN